MGNHPECKSYDEALKKEEKFIISIGWRYIGGYMGQDLTMEEYAEKYFPKAEFRTTKSTLAVTQYRPFSITIGRICIALSNNLKDEDVINCHINQNGELVLRTGKEFSDLINLKISDTDENMNIEKITKLLKLLKP